MSWNTYFLNYLCQTWSHSWHLVDCRIALLFQALTLPNVCGFVLSRLLIVLMGFPRLPAAADPKTAYIDTRSKLNDMRHAWCVVWHCRPQHTGGINGWLKFASHWVIWRRIISYNSKYMAECKLETIQNLLRMNGEPCSSMLTLVLVILTSIQYRKSAVYQPCRMQVELVAMLNFNRYSELWPMLSPICLRMCSYLKLS